MPFFFCSFSLFFFFVLLSQTGQRPHRLYPPFHCIHFTFELKRYPPAPLVGFSNAAGLFRLLCLQPLEHTVKICQSLIRGAFSLY